MCWCWTPARNRLSISLCQVRGAGTYCVLRAQIIFWRSTRSTAAGCPCSAAPCMFQDWGVGGAARRLSLGCPGCHHASVFSCIRVWSSCMVLACSTVAGCWAVQHACVERCASGAASWVGSWQSFRQAADGLGPGHLERWREQGHCSKTAIDREQLWWGVAASTLARAYGIPTCGLLDFEVV